MLLVQLSIMTQKYFLHPTQCHWPRGGFWSAMTTTSPTFRLSFSLLLIWVLSVAKTPPSSASITPLAGSDWVSRQYFLGLNAKLSVILGARCQAAQASHLHPHMGNQMYRNSDDHLSGHSCIPLILHHPHNLNQLERVTTFCSYISGEILILKCDQL